MSTEGDPAPDAFADLPFVPGAATARGASARRGRWLAGVLVVAACAGVAVAYLVRPAEPDPNAPRAVLEVEGMHCPIQCGLRVTGALEQLPFVFPGSVTASPQTGIVTFAVADGHAVDVESTRRAIDGAGFRCRSVKLPAAEPQ